MQSITNRILEKAFDIKLPSIKRYALLVLGLNPEVGQASGVQRTYDRDEAYMVYLMSVLVKDFRMKLGIARRHLINVWRQLDADSLLPSQIWEGKIPDVDLWIYTPGLYELRTYSRREEIDLRWEMVHRAPGEIEHAHVKEEYHRKRFPLNPPELSGEIYILQLRPHLFRFRQALKDISI
jgi:hypothetical protein